MLNKILKPNGRIYVRLSELEPWDKNPRVHDEESLERRKSQIARLGQFRDIFVNEEGKAIGGNRTLKALKYLNENIYSWIDNKDRPQQSDRRGQFDEVKISELVIGEKEVEGSTKYFAIIDGQSEETLFDSIEQLFIEYNVSDNDPGEWDKKALKLLLAPHKDLIPQRNYKLNILPSTPLKDFISPVAKQPKPEKVIICPSCQQEFKLSAAASKTE